VVAGTEDRRVRIWLGDLGSPRANLDVEEGPALLAKTARPPGVDVRLGRIGNRRILLTGHRGRVDVWDIAEPWGGVNHLIASRGRTEDTWHSLATYVGQGRALMATVEGAAGPLRVIDALTGDPVLQVSMERPEPLGFLARDGRVLLALTDRNRLHLLDVDTGNPVLHPQPVGWTSPSLALADVGDVATLAILDDQELRLLDLATGEPRVPTVPIRSTPHGLAFGRVGGRQLLLSAHFATVRVWNPRTGRKVTQLPFGTSIDAMSVHQVADDRLVVAVSGPGVVLVELREAPP
jgi:hypothetical protein